MNFQSLHPEMFLFLKSKADLYAWLLIYRLRELKQSFTSFPIKKKKKINFFLIIRYWQGRHQPIILREIYQHPLPKTRQPHVARWQEKRATNCAQRLLQLTNYRLFLSCAWTEHPWSHHVPCIWFLNSHQAPRAFVRAARMAGLKSASRWRN